MFCRMFRSRDSLREAANAQGSLVAILLCRYIGLPVTIQRRHSLPWFGHLISLRHITSSTRDISLPKSSSRASIIDLKINDISKLQDIEAKRKEVILLLQFHAYTLTPSALSTLMHMHGKIAKIPLDDYTATLFTQALADTPLNGTQICHALSILHSPHQYSEAICELLTALTTHLRACHTQLTPKDISKALFAFKSIEYHSSPEVSTLLDCLSNKLLTSHGLMDGQSISAALYGLQNTSDRSPTTLSILQFITHELSITPITFTSQGIGMVMYGLKCMSSHSLQVRGFLREIVKVVTRSQLTFNAQSFGMALFGCNRMDASTSEIRQLLAALLQAIETTPRFQVDKYTPTMVLFGLSNMDVTVPEVQRVVSKICSLMEANLRLYDLDTICTLCYSMQTMNGATEPEQRLVQLLCTIIERLQGSFPANRLPNLLFGLQRFTTVGNPLMTRFLEAIGSKLPSSYGELSIDEIAKALFGLRNCALPSNWTPLFSTWLLTLLSYLSTKMADGVPSLQLLLLVFVPSKGVLFTSLRYSDYTSPHPLMMRIKIKVLLQEAALFTKLRSVPFSSRAERLFAIQIQQVLTHCELHFNQLYYGFEMDIVVSIREQGLLVNMEVDGIHHRDSHKQYFCSLRDEYLQDLHGISVVRIDIMSPKVRNMTRVEFKEFILLKLQQQATVRSPA